jgi:hypothetical protein
MKYEIKIEGADDPKGTVNLVRLTCLADSLRRIAEGALQIRLRGLSFPKGRKKINLDEALTIYLTGIREGSTCLDLEADTFANTISNFQPDIFRQDIQQDLPTLTPISLFMTSYQEAIKDNPSPDLLDKPLLKELKNFKKVFLNENETLKLSNQGSVDSLIINNETFNRIRILEEEIPNPKTIIINGTVELLKFSQQKVTIQTEDGMVDGFLSDEIDTDLIARFWGKEITISGITHYKPGDKFIIEIEKIFEPTDGDHFFSKKPKSESIEQQIERQLREHKFINQLPDIIGKWPGDESLEELISMLTK